MSGLAGGVPNAWEYAEARRVMRFRRVHRTNPVAAKGEPRRLVFECCGLCTWEVCASFVGEEAPVDVWGLVYEHCADHAIGLVA